MTAKWAATDWFWRFSALLCLALLPVSALLVWDERRYGFWQSVGELLKDIGLTIVYGNYDNTKL